MNFIETDLSGAYIIEFNPIKDERGFFTRTFCKNEFAAQGLICDFVQCDISRSINKYTLRGMHFQTNSSEEVKLVRCNSGRIQDVIIDLRSNSPSYCKYISVELSEENDKMLYIPVGFAHGFLTLEPNCEVTYMVSTFYSSVNEKGVRWNDSIFDIRWNAEPLVVSDKDAKHQDYIKLK